MRKLGVLSAVVMLSYGCEADFSWYLGGGGSGGASSSSSSQGSGGTGGTLICVPGAMAPCYDGPAGTEGVGVCKAGVQTCAGDGKSWGACTGEVLPAPVDCASGMDMHCDGMVTPCKGTVLWAKRFGGAANQFTESIAVDGNGNVLVAGYYLGGSVDFGGGTLPSTGNDFNIFVVKLDPSGKHLWSKGFGDAQNQVGRSIAADVMGNVLVTGYFAGSVDFGGGALTSAGGQDVFVVKLDASGKHLWSKGFGDAKDQAGQSIAVDPMGNAVVTGFFNGSVGFGPIALTSAGEQDIFVVKLDPSGGHLWSKGFGDAQSQVGQGVAVDAAGNVLVTGYFNGSVDFGGGLLTSVDAADVFVAKFKPDGMLSWANAYGNVSDQIATGIAADSAGNVVVTGYFNGAIDFGGGSLVSAGAVPGPSDIFIAELTAGGTYTWAHRFGDSNDQRAAGVAVGLSGKVLITGAMTGQADFGAGPLASAGGQDIFVAKLDADQHGGCVWAKRFGDADAQWGTAITTNAAGDVFIAGAFHGSVDFGGNLVLASAGGADVFVAKLSP